MRVLPMVPTTGEALLILVAAVLPGAMFTFAFEREAGAYTITAADRVLRFVMVSAAFDLAYAVPLYLARDRLLDDAGPPRFAAGWLAVAVALALPALCGTVLGGLYATRTTRKRWHRLRRVLPLRAEAWLLRVAVGHNSEPRAWDHAFAGGPTTYVRVRTTDGTWVGGLFATKSYAGQFPHDGDLFLEEVWPIDANGTFGDAPTGYGAYVPASAIAFVEIVPPAEEAAHV